MLVDPDPSAWSVQFDGVPQSVTLVGQVFDTIVLTTSAGSPAEILLSYAGGGFVVGDVSGLPLAPATDFPVGIV